MKNLINRAFSLVGKAADKMRESRNEARAKSDDQLFNVKERNNKLYIVCGGVAVASCNADTKAGDICFTIQEMRKAQRDYNQL